MVTIKQIAQKAGVSSTTVSNVLHGKTSKVSNETLSKVRAILEEENYTPNMAAHILAHKNSRIIGVIMFMEPRSDETVLEDPFTSAILGAIEQEIRDANYFMMLHTTNDKDDVLRLAATWKLSGLILLWVPAEISSIIRRSIETPLVFIDCYFNDDGQIYNNIGLEDTKGGYEMTRYLLSMGHRKIAFLSNVAIYPSTDHARFAGYKQAFQEKGIPYTEDSYIPISKKSHERYELYRRLITHPFPYSALFFSADYYAFDAINFFQNNGIKIPEQISIAGFDNNHFAQIIRPHLTTIHQTVYQKGQIAVRMLLKIIKKDPLEESEVRLPIHLKIRDSVCRIK